MLSWSLISTDIKLEAYNVIYLIIFSIALLVMLVLKKRFWTFKS